MERDRERERARKNIRTAIALGLIALASFALFVYQVWRYG